MFDAPLKMPGWNGACGRSSWWTESADGDRVSEPHGLPLRIFTALRFGVFPIVNATATMVLGW